MSSNSICLHEIINDVNTVIYGDLSEQSTEHKNIPRQGEHFHKIITPGKIDDKSNYGIPKNIKYPPHYIPSYDTERSDHENVEYDYDEEDEDGYHVDESEDQEDVCPCCRNHGESPKESKTLYDDDAEYEKKREKPGTWYQKNEEFHPEMHDRYDTATDHRTGITSEWLKSCKNSLKEFLNPIKCKYSNAYNNAADQFCEKRRKTFTMNGKSKAEKDHGSYEQGKDQQKCNVSNPHSNESDKFGQTGNLTSVPLSARRIKTQKEKLLLYMTDPNLFIPGIRILHKRLLKSEDSPDRIARLRDILSQT